MKYCWRCAGEFTDDTTVCPDCVLDVPKVKTRHRRTLPQQPLTADELYPSLADWDMAMDLAHGQDWKDI